MSKNEHMGIKEDIITINMTCDISHLDVYRRENKNLHKWKKFKSLEI